MTEPRSFASLTPGPLARKGSARPAMRPQIQPLQQFHEATARQMDIRHEDLGWNDMGEDEAAVPAAVPTDTPAEIVPLAGVTPAAQPPVPAVVRQREAIAEAVAPAAPRRSALAAGRRAAFTLRLDAERHLRLRLAATVEGRSAQQIVTRALDQLLAEMPELETLAAHVEKRG